MTNSNRIRSRRALWRSVIAVVVLAVAGCDSADDGDPLERFVTLSPVADDGAAWIELTGAAVTHVTAANAQVFFAAHGDTTQVVIVRTDPGPLDFAIRVADPTETPVGVALEVADDQNRLRDASTYRVLVQP
jgi:hypothetical protein